MQNMEVVTIEQATFELLRQKLDDFVRRMDDLCAPYCKRHIEWLDNCEVTRLLAVSSRTLQTYRDTGKLPYSQINGKIYYKTSDVEAFIQNQQKSSLKA